MPEQPTVVRTDYLRRWRAANKDIVNLQNRSYVKRNPDARAKSSSEWRKRNKLKRRAHRMVEYAIAKGRMIRQSCQSCGNTKSQSHHDDYTKPLEVRWLCAACHGKEHRHES